jgi:MraZ protein
MATFDGSAKAKLEDNNRISLPKIFYKAIDEDERNELLLTLETDACILVYPRSRWDSRMEKLVDEDFEEDTERVWKVRNLQEKMKPVKVDRQGRFYVPNDLKEEAGIEKEVTIVGMRTRFEIWSPDKLEEMRRKRQA